MRTPSFIMVIALLSLTGLLAVACSDTADPTAPTRIGGGSTDVTGGNRTIDVRGGPKGKVDICHRRNGAGDSSSGDSSSDDSSSTGTTSNGFRIRSVRANALQAHLRHGDGQPYGLVPFATDKAFDASCAQVPTSICPCAQPFEDAVGDWETAKGAPLDGEFVDAAPVQVLCREYAGPGYILLRAFLYRGFLACAASITVGESSRQIPLASDAEFAACGGLARTACGVP